MVDIIKGAIAAGEYKLSEIRDKIMRMYIRGLLTEAQMDELLRMASGNASAGAERPDVMQMLQSLDARILAIEKKLSGEEEGAAYEPWKPWDGISTRYQYGEIVSHGGKLWQSVFSGQNVWEPGAPGTEAMWTAYGEA